VWFRLAVWYAAFFVVSSAVLFGLAYLILASSLQRQDRDVLEAKLREIAAQYEAGGLTALQRTLLIEQRTVRRRPFLVRVARPGGNTIFITTPDQWADFDLTRLDQPPTMAPKDRWIEIHARDDSALLDVVSTQVPDDTVLQVGLSTERRDIVLEQFAWIVFAILIPIGVAGMAGGAYLATRALRPIRQLIHTVHAIDAGAMEARVATRGTGDELDELGVLFNGMLDRIAALINGMRAALDTVAHDLRTPMARLRAIAEVALRAEPDGRASAEALADCVEESDRVLTMLNTLMDISEARTGTLRLDLDTLNVRSLFDDTIELYRDIAEDSGIRIEATAPSDLSLTADRNRMRQVIANMLDNALKYTARGGRFALTTYAENAQIVIVVEDNGIGIAPTDLPWIWDRLYRGDPGRTRRGLGLGLSLVRAIVHAHKGRVDVSSEPGNGSRFMLFFPAASPSPR
jgi:signal transduction histidine kinase